MRFTTILSVAAVAGVSVAQSSVAAAPAAPTPSTGVITGTSSCPAQNILVTCLGTQADRMKTCAPLDYGCQCQIQGDVLGCYNQCPSDANRSSEDAKLTAYCVAASATIVKTTTPTPTGTFSVVSSSTSGAKSATPTDDSSDSQATDSSSPSGSGGSGNGGSRSSPTTTGGASRASSTDSAAAKITWMCGSSLLAVLTTAFMAL
ncbi:hypothetical protein ABW21_db0201551 [Orbilia brochopaga]|nr:hypothetical protein ABW21_db0201551 [Drechslerella brochopaga]